jgi:hypothetical protein
MAPEVVEAPALVDWAVAAVELPLEKQPGEIAPLAVAAERDQVLRAA